MGEGRDLVRALIAEGGGLPIGLSNEKLADEIKRVRKALDLLGLGSASA